MKHHSHKVQTTTSTLSHKLHEVFKATTYEPQTTSLMGPSHKLTNSLVLLSLIVPKPLAPCRTTLCLWYREGYFYEGVQIDDPPHVQNCNQMRAGPHGPKVPASAAVTLLRTIALFRVVAKDNLNNTHAKFFNNLG